MGGGEKKKLFIEAVIFIWGKTNLKSSWCVSEWLFCGSTVVHMVSVK